MKLLPILLLACFAGVAQTPPPPPQFPNVPDETVICTFDDGVSLTAGEFKKIVAVLPPESQPAAVKDPQTFLHQWALMRKLTKMAMNDKLDEQSPTREKAEYYRMMTLSEAAMMDADRHITITPAEAKAYYEAHHDNYKEVRVKAIYIPFSGEASASISGGTKSRTEEQAKALAAKIEGELRGGADFVKLVAQYSEDPTSKAKDGDFATIHGSDNIPAEIRAVVMALKPGEVSGPIRQPTAIYLFRAESVSYKQFDDVSNEIFTQMHRDRYTQWMDQTNRDSKVEFKSPTFFGTAQDTGKQPSGAH